MAAKVSVIMPVYNAAKYLKTSVGSLLAQTYPHLEVLCVDDGSTDGSLAMLQEYASEDKRVRIFQTDHSGAGKARNVALEAASGDYIAFLDADDYVDTTLFEKAVAKADGANADIVIWDLWYYDEHFQRNQYPPQGVLNYNYFEGDDPVFSYKRNPGQIFTSFQNWIWNKMFRRSFLVENNLRFPDLHRTQDLEFTAMALVLAKRITLMPERLSHYRVNSGTSNMDNKDKHPLDFMSAFISLKSRLEQAGIYTEVKQSYVNWALCSSLYNLVTLKQFSTFKSVFVQLKADGFTKMDITSNASASYIYVADWYADYRYIQEHEAEDYLMYCMTKYRLAEQRYVGILDQLGDELRTTQAQRDSLSDECSTLHDECNSLRNECSALRNSRSYRLSNAICNLPHALRSFVRRLTSRR